MQHKLAQNLSASSYLELHPREKLATKHLSDALALGHNEGGEVDESDDTTLLALLSALLVAKTLDGVGSDKATVGVHNENNLLALIGESLEDSSDGVGVVCEALGGGLSADRRVLNGLNRVAARLEELLSRRVAGFLVPRTRCEDESGLGGRHDWLCVGCVEELSEDGELGRGISRKVESLNH